MKIAILFWFYKEIDICKNRLALLRQNNPNIPIYGVYGGDLSTVNDYKIQLDKLLDDFYAFPEDKDSQWKWLQGDLILTQWYRDRGKDLSWDTVVIVQWDMLVFGNIEHLFSMLKLDHILLSGLRPIKEVENDWLWVTPKIPKHREQYFNFLEYVKKNYNYQQEPMGCIFIVVCLPRIFLEAYSKIDQPELGFIEYRIPMYAQIFDIPFCENHPFQAWWVDNDPIFQSNNIFQRTINLVKIRLNPNPLNPTRNDISLIPIFRHLNTQSGSRVFHPYQYLFPLKKQQWISAILDEFKRDLKWLSQKIFNRN
jgi:hypothetical protein